MVQQRLLEQHGLMSLESWPSERFRHSIAYVVTLVAHDGGARYVFALQIAYRLCADSYASVMMYANTRFGSLVAAPTA